MILHNPTNTPIKDFPIQSPSSKVTNMWSIMPGERLEFPDFEGAYLLETYGFLQRVITKSQLDKETAEKKALDENKHFNQTLIVDEKGNEIHEAPSVPVAPPAQFAGLTSEAMKPAQPPRPATSGESFTPTEGTVMPLPPVAPTAPVVAATNKVPCSHPSCDKVFDTPKAFQMHYAFNHVEIPNGKPTTPATT